MFGSGGQVRRGHRLRSALVKTNDAPSARDLLRWSEALAAIARTGLAFSDVVYERERFEEVLHVAADTVSYTHLRAHET